MTTEMTAGQKALQWITESCERGKTVHVCTMTKITAIKRKHIQEWEAMGRPLFRLTDSGDLLMASGKHYVKLTAGNMRLVQFRAV